MKVIERYLESSSGSPSFSIEDCFQYGHYTYNNLWRYALCIPIREESESFEKLWNSLSQLTVERFIVVFVINARRSDTNEVKNSNLQWLKKIKQSSLSFEQNKGHLFGSSKNFDFICINHSQEGLFFTDKQGVGHARKIGCDFILQLIRHGSLKSNWIWTSDGDAQLPPKYFEISKNIDKKTPAILYPFKHDREQGTRFQKCAISLYEMSLHYYVHGLQWAQSSYAHMSVGSSIAIQANAYAVVRGFPEKLAGEDFYILNKLRKLGQFHTIDDESLIIRLSSRASNRVPFGTGASVLKLMHNLQQKEDFYLYSPNCFSDLKNINRALPELKSAQQLTKLSGFQTLQKIGLEPGFRQILEQAPEHQREKQLRDCFDGFKTMRFIHELTEKKHPKIYWREALNQFNQLAA